MNTIGSFRLEGKNYTGNVNTLGYSGPLSIEPNPSRKSDDSPDFYAYGGKNRTQMGACWSGVSEETGNSYVNVKLDDPSFPAPINARLVQFKDEEGYRLVWSRS